MNRQTIVPAQSPFPHPHKKHPLPHQFPTAPTPSWRRLRGLLWARMATRPSASKSRERLQIHKTRHTGRQTNLQSTRLFPASLPKPPVPYLGQTAETKRDNTHQGHSPGGTSRNLLSSQFRSPPSEAISSIMNSLHSTTPSATPPRRRPNLPRPPRRPAARRPRQNASRPPPATSAHAPLPSMIGSSSHMPAAS
jgi:hypothetical protein